MSRSAAELEQALTIATRRADELQAWVDAAEEEAEPLRLRAEAAESEVKRFKDRLSLLGNEAGGDAHFAVENRKLVERVSELESCNHSLRALSTQLATQAEEAGRRTVDQLTSRLAQAKLESDTVRTEELRAALEEAKEAVATLQVQREAAVEQVRRYVTEDARAQTKAEAEAAQLVEALATKTDELAVMNQRLHAHAAAEERLESELASMRARACSAEEAIAHAQNEAALLRAGQSDTELQLRAMTEQVKEARRAEAQTTELNRTLTLERVVVNAAPPPANVLQLLPVPPPPPADALGDDGDGLEGYSPQRLHLLEVQLAAEQVKSSLLQEFARTCQVSLARTQDQLEAAGGRLADLSKMLQNAGGETSEVMERLDAARRELHALKKELTRAMDSSGTQPASEPVREPVREAETEGELVDPNDVLDAPMAELDALVVGQGAAVREAAEALAGDLKARELLLGDLLWLKLEMEKLTNVREDLRQRVRAMVQRELNRKQVMGALLQKLRSTEVASAARAGSLRRLHAALELAQARAARVQTIYFQKQIGSMQRQLERRKAK